MTVKRGAKRQASPQVAAAADSAEGKPKPTPPKKRATPVKAGGRVADTGAATARRGKTAAAGPPAPVPSAPVGRPTLYQPEHCARIVELAASDGMGASELALELGVSRQTWENWKAAHPEFREAVADAKFAALAWWERKGRLGINEGKSFNATAFVFQVKNRFREDYQDEKVRKHEVGDSVSSLMNDLDGRTGRFRAAA
jgi:hypothetical protein